MSRNGHTKYSAVEGATKALELAKDMLDIVLLSMQRTNSDYR